MRRSYTRILLAAAAIGAAHALHAPALSISSKGIAAPKHEMATLNLVRKSIAAPTHENEALRLRGGSSTGALIFSLFKAIVGSGVLCLAGGIASFTNDVKYLPAAWALAAFSCVVSAYCYYNVGRVCEATGAVSYKQAWAKTVGAGTAWIPSMVIILQTTVATICYAIIIGDVLRDLSRSAGLTGMFRDRNTLLGMMGAFVLLPLCLLRDFGMLAYTSMFGVAGIIYTAIFMTYRFLSGAYKKGGELTQKLRMDQRPEFGSKFVPIKVLILVSMFNTAFLAHYDAPKFLGMVHHNMVQWKKLVEGSFIAALSAILVIMSMGFLTFGGGSLGLILNNYAANDTLALLARGGMLASITFGFPLVFSGFRSGLLAFLDITHPSQVLLDTMAVVTVASACMIGMVMTDLGFAASFSGALFGSALIYVFPSIMYASLSKQKVADDQKLPTKRGFLQSGPVSKGLKLTNEYYINIAIAALGVCLAGIGATVSYLQSFTDILN